MSFVDFLMKLSGATRAVRRQHYHFAHRMLPRLAHGDPARIFAFLTLDPDDFLRSLWQDCADLAEIAGDRPDRRFRPPALRRTVDRTEWFVVSLPEPRACPEAYFVALGFHGDGASFELTVFTLELAGDGDAPVLGRHNPDGTHTSFGARDIPRTPEAFLDGVLRSA